MSQTILKYHDTALPTTAAAVTLFNSALAMPPGGWFHLLEQAWFQYDLRYTSTSGTGVATVTGQFSNDKGANWTTFYTGAAGSDSAGTQDEVYVGLYKDIRFLLTMTTNSTLTFAANLALHCDKASSKVLAGERLVVTPA